MSLFEISDGIVGTHVTFEEIEKKMQESLGTKAKFGPNRNATAIGDFRGFVSKVALIDPDWIDKNDGEDLPKEFVCKISSLLNMKLMREMMHLKEADGWNDEKFEKMGPLIRDFHNREVFTYLLMMKELKNGNKSLAFPKVFGYQTFDETNDLKGYIITELVPDLYPVSMHESIPVKTVESIVQAVASFSAIGTRLSDEELKFLGEMDIVKKFSEEFFDEIGCQSVSASMKEEFPSEFHQQIDEFFDIFKNVINTPKCIARMSKAADFLNHKPVLLHGDLWASNFLLSKKGQDELELKGIIDYQIINIGSPGLDMARLFAACLSKEDRRENWERLLRIFYDQFVKEIGDCEIPYTFEQLVQSYNLFFPISSIMVIPGLTQFFKNPRIEKSEKDKWHDATMQKMIALLEDILAIHKSNVKEVPQFFEKTMSLFEISDGIVGTHVTFDEIEKKMQESLVTKAKFGPNRNATAIGDFRGFASKVALIDPDWIDKNEGEELPKEFVCKISSSLNLKLMREMMHLKEEDGWSDEKFEKMGPLIRDLHNREVFTFSLMMREFKNGNKNLAFPKVFGYQAFDETNDLKGYIITELVPDLHPVSMHESIPLKTAESVVKAVASFSAIKTRLSDEELKLVGAVDIAKKLSEEFLDETGYKSMTANMKEEFPPEYHQRIDEYAEIFTKFINTPKCLANMLKAADLLNHKPVLLHGDLWGANMLFSKKDQDELELKALIDYQIINLGSPGLDMARLFAVCLSKEDRRENWERLLRIFYDQFVKEIGDCEIPYTFEQLVQSYNLFFPTSSIMVIPGLTQFFKNPRIEKSEKDKWHDTTMQKMIALLEDSLTIHKSNLKQFPQFFE
ncbi:unnamed protein product [Caenorhabditis bovis]|uniref:CHK kinase-like domain-containing protein n=1 Tax=Caenorhabditis bovis TaxID=2654633 RepID=A0A8S1E660_9PELO|nr:unnamed protein product [Caenorhabditis bovis]